MSLPFVNREQPERTPVAADHGAAPPAGERGANPSAVPVSTSRPFREAEQLTGRRQATKGGIPTAVFERRQVQCGRPRGPGATAPGVLGPPPRVALAPKPNPSGAMRAAHGRETSPPESTQPARAASGHDRRPQCAVERPGRAGTYPRVHVVSGQRLPVCVHSARPPTAAPNWREPPPRAPTDGATGRAVRGEPASRAGDTQGACRRSKGWKKPRWIATRADAPPASPQGTESRVTAVGPGEACGGARGSAGPSRTLGDSIPPGRTRTDLSASDGTLARRRACNRGSQPGARRDRHGARGPASPRGGGGRGAEGWGVPVSSESGAPPGPGPYSH